MRGNFHEQLRHDAVKPPSERSTGIVFAVMTAVVAVIYRETTLVAIGFAGLSLLLGLLSWRCPKVLRPLNSLWFRFGMLMHRVVNPVVMLAMFAIAIVPAGLIMQLVRDPLVKRRKPLGQSYWVETSATSHAASSMRHQF